jgi:hypothetical protein
VSLAFPFDFASLAQGDDLLRGYAAGKAQDDGGFGAKWIFAVNTGGIPKYNLGTRKNNPSS